MILLHYLAEFGIHYGLVMLILCLGMASAYAQSIGPSASSYGAAPGANTVPFTAMVQIPANTLGGNATNAAGNIQIIPMGQCDGAMGALGWTPGVGPVCNGSLHAATADTATTATTATSATTASTLNGNTFAAPGDIGTGTPGNVYGTNIYSNGVLIKPPLRATTAALGGSLLLLGGCVSNTTSVPGATTSMSVNVSPSSDPGAGAVFLAFVSSAGNVLTRVCGLLTITPPSITYNIAVLQ